MKGEDKDLDQDSNSVISTLLNLDDMILASQEDAYESLDLNAKQKYLCDFSKGEREEDQPESQGRHASEGAPKEALTVEEVMMSDKERGVESHGGRQEEGEVYDNNMEEE